MSQKVPLKSHVTKYGMYSKYKPTQEKSNNRHIFDLKLYRKEASMKEALLWFVRCLERWKEKDMAQSGKLSQAHLFGFRC